MLYRLMLNYFRIKLIRYIIALILNKKSSPGKPLKQLNLLEYGFQWVSAYFLKPKKSVSK